MEILSNTKNSRPVKVLSDRLNRTIKQFFLSQYSTAERAAVQRVIMDMNASYQAFVHELFPNAELIIESVPHYSINGAGRWIPFALNV